MKRKEATEELEKLRNFVKSREDTREEYEQEHEVLQRKIQDKDIALSVISGEYGSMKEATQKEIESLWGVVDKLDKLDGEIGGDFFDKMAGQWREEQVRCLRDIERHQDAEKSYMGEGVQILELASNAQSLFERQPAREKRRLLNFLLSNCSWEDGEVIATFRQPFDLLAKTVADAAHVNAEDNANLTENEIWLGDLDSNQDYSGQSRRFYR